MTHKNFSVGNILPYNMNTKNLLIICCMIVLVVGIISVVIYFTTSMVIKYENFEMVEPNLTPNDDEIVVGLFWTDWCPHCVSFKPIFEKVAAAHSETTTKTSGKKLRFEKVDCVALAPLAKKYGVQGYPTIKIIRGENDMDEYEGSRDEHEFTKYLITL